MSKVHQEVTINVGGKYLFQIQSSGSPEVMEGKVLEIVASPGTGTLYLVSFSAEDDPYYREDPPPQRRLRKAFDRFFMMTPQKQHHYTRTMTYEQFSNALCTRTASITVGL